MSLITSDFQKLVRNEPRGLLDVQMHDLVGDTVEDFSPYGFAIESLDIPAGFSPIQGFSRDANFWIEFNTTSIVKYDIAGTLLLTNSTPFDGLPAGLNHIGDGVLYGGFIYVGMSDGSSLFVTVKFDVIDLSLVSYTDITAYKCSSATCLSVDKTEIYAVQYNVSGDNKIYRFNINDFSYLGDILLSEPLLKMQGIDTSTDGFIYISTDHNTTPLLSDGMIRTVYPDGTVIPEAHRGFGMFTGEIEGLCVYDNKLMYHIINSIPKEMIRYVDLDDCFLNDDSGYPSIKVASTLPESGTILIRTKPFSFYNYNNIFSCPDPSTTHWVAWYNIDGTLHFRVDSAIRIEVASTTLAEHILAFSWTRNGADVDIKVGVDGVYVGSLTQPWQALPVDGLYLHSATDSTSPNGKNFDRGYAVINRELTAQEILDVNNDWNGMYDLFATSGDSY